VKKLTKIAKKNHIIIAAGLMESRGKAVQYSCPRRSKGLIGFHRKSSLPDGEEKFSDIGQTKRFRYQGIKVGIAICYESVNPETCRALAQTARN